MNFQELHNITENFCDAHSFVTFGEPVFDYDHQYYKDISSTKDGLIYASNSDASLILKKLKDLSSYDDSESKPKFKMKF